MPDAPQSIRYFISYAFMAGTVPCFGNNVIVMTRPILTAEQITNITDALKHDLSQQSRFQGMAIELTIISLTRLET